MLNAPKLRAEHEQNARGANDSERGRVMSPTWRAAVPKPANLVAKISLRQCMLKWSRTAFDNLPDTIGQIKSDQNTVFERLDFTVS